MQTPTSGRITVDTPKGYAWKNRATGKKYYDRDTFTSSIDVIFDEVPE